MTAAEQLAAEMMADELYQQALASIESAMYEAMIAGDPTLYSGAVSNVALERARDLAHTAAESLTRQLTETQLSSMGDIIAQGLAEGKRPVDLYNQLQDVTGLDTNRAKSYLALQERLEQSSLTDAQIQDALDREYQRLLQDRRKTIAQTEGRKATSAAREAAAEERGDLWKRSISAGDDRVSDICAENEAAGMIGIDEEFPSGDITTPFHPNCRCTISYVKSDKAKEIGQKRAEEAAAATAAAKAGTANGGTDDGAD